MPPKTVSHGATVTSAATAGRTLILASFLSATGFTALFPLLPIYVRELSGPGATAALWSGLAMSATPMAGAVVSPLWGWLADRVGYRPMLLRALGSTTIIVGLMALPNAAWQLVLLRGLAGALGSFQAAAMGALTSWSKAEDLSRAVSHLQMASVFGAILGPVAGGAIAAVLGVRSAAVAGAVALALGTIVVARWFREPAIRRARPRGTDAAPRPTLLWLPMLTLVAVQFTESSFNPILPLLLARGDDEVGSVAWLSGLAVALSATAGIVGSALAGRAFKRGVGRWTMAGAAGSLALLALAALAAPLPWGVFTLRVLCGGVAAGMAVAAFSAGGLAMPPHQRGFAYGWLSSASMAGYAASPIAAGTLATFDLRAVLAVDTVLCLIATVGWGWSRRVAPGPDWQSPPEGEVPSLARPEIADVPARPPDRAPTESAIGAGAAALEGPSASSTDGERGTSGV